MSEYITCVHLYVMEQERVDLKASSVAPIGGLGGRRFPKIPQFFFIGFNNSMFNISTCISSLSTF